MASPTVEVARARRKFFQDASSAVMGTAFQAKLPLKTPLMEHLASTTPLSLRETSLRKQMFAYPLTVGRTTTADGSTHWLQPTSPETRATAFSTLLLPSNTTLEPHVGEACCSGNVRHLLATIRLSWKRDDTFHETTFITIIAAPFVGSMDVSLADMWTDDVLSELFNPEESLISIDKPAFGMIQGTTRDFPSNTDAWSVEECVKQAGLVIFPSFGSQASSVDNIQRLFLLPSGCNYPIGIMWPHDVGYDSFLESLGVGHSLWKGLSDLLSTHSSVFQPWFGAVATSPDRFALSGALITADIFTQINPLSITSSQFPDGIEDPEETTHLHDMFQGWLSSVYNDWTLSYCSLDQYKLIHQYWEFGRGGIPRSYLHHAYHPCLCPNFQYHFDWPSAGEVLEFPFATAFPSTAVSLNAQRYKRRTFNPKTSKPYQHEILSKSAQALADLPSQGSTPLTPDARRPSPTRNTTATQPPHILGVSDASHSHSHSSLSHTSRFSSAATPRDSDAAARKVLFQAGSAATKPKERTTMVRPVASTFPSQPARSSGGLFDSLDTQPIIDAAHATLSRCEKLQRSLENSAPHVAWLLVAFSTLCHCNRSWLHA